MDNDEVPSKMTHNELVDLRMNLRVFKQKIQDMLYDLSTLKDACNELTLSIEDKIIHNLSDD